MKASNGIILNIHEAQIDPTLLDLSKLNACMQVLHGNVDLTTKTCTCSDYLPKWNQTFYIEKQSESIELKLIHKPILLKEQVLASCTLSAKTQSGWSHLFKSNTKIGSVKVSITSESPSVDPVEINDLFQKKVSEVQTIKTKLSNYKLLYETEKTEPRLNPKVEELLDCLKQEQDDYLCLFNEVNEKKKVLKEQEELVEKEKGRLMKAREEVRKEELEIRKEQKRLQSQFEGLMIVKSRASVQERILKGYHRNSKSEGKPGLRSPINREACSALLPNQVSSLTLSYNNSNK